MNALQRRSRFRYLALAAAASVLVAACGSDDDSASTATTTATSEGSASQTSDTAPLEPVTLRLEELAGNPSNITDWIADEEGFFDDRGITAEFTQVQRAADGLAAAVGGQLDVFRTQPALTAEAVAQGECFRHIEAGPGNTLNLIGDPDLELQHTDEEYPDNVLDVEGRSIGVSVLGGGPHRMMSAAMEDAGLDPLTDATFIAVGAGAPAIAAFQQGQVDLLISYPPIEQTLAPTEFQMVLDFINSEGHAFENAITAGVAATCDLIDNHPDTVNRYCQAIWDAYDFLSDEANADRVAEVLAARMPADVALTSAIWDSVAPAYTQRTYTAELWDFQAQFLPEGATPQPFEDAVYGPCMDEDPR